MEAFKNRANCEGTDPEAFFTQEESKQYADVVTLRKICGNCAAKTECLDYSLKNEVLGFWGGLTELQRSKMRQRLGIVSRPLYLDYN